MINLTVKKIYCPKCQKLVRVKLLQSGGKNQFSCLKCNTLIWQKEGLRWKYNKGE